MANHKRGGKSISGDGDFLYGSLTCGQGKAGCEHNESSHVAGWELTGSNFNRSLFYREALSNLCASKCQAVYIPKVRYLVISLGLYIITYFMKFKNYILYLLLCNYVQFYIILCNFSFFLFIFNTFINPSIKSYTHLSKYQQQKI